MQQRAQWQTAVGSASAIESVCQLFIKFRIQSKWNELPDVLANAVTLNRFKYVVKKSLFLRCRFRLCEEITHVFSHTCANVIFSLQYFQTF